MKYICVILILFITSCDRYGIDFEIHNDDVRTIDSIIISNGFNISKSLSLKPKEETLIFLDFKENNTHSDGNFFIKYYINGEQKLKTFGYYSGKNGQIDHPIPVQIDHLFRLKLTVLS